MPRIMVVNLAKGVASGEGRPLHDATAPEVNAQFSPDGKWVAYVSSESGTSEIYLHAFPAAGARARISTEGGFAPRWSYDGRELIYMGGLPSTRLFSVDVPVNDPLRAGVPKLVFQANVMGTTWDVTHDKNRFLIELTSSGGTRLATVTNWFTELVTKAPPKK